MPEYEVTVRVTSISTRTYTVGNAPDEPDMSEDGAKEAALGCASMRNSDSRLEVVGLKQVA